MPSQTPDKKPLRTPAVRRRTPAYVKATRGVRNWREAAEWLAWRDIEDIECITPDQAGIARGKRMSAAAFEGAIATGLTFARSVYGIDARGENVDAAVGVPEMRPVAVFTVTPGGSPVALKLVGLLVAVIW